MSSEFGRSLSERLIRNRTEQSPITVGRQRWLSSAHGSEIDPSTLVCVAGAAHHYDDS